MGYELKMILVEEQKGMRTIADMKAIRHKINSELPDGADLFPLQPIHGVEIGRIDLCCIVGELAKLVASTDLDPGAFFADDGNKLISRDRYDEKIRRVLARDVLKAMERDIKQGEKDGHVYRRFSIAHALLKSILDTFDANNITCYFFGH